MAQCVPFLFSQSPCEPFPSSKTPPILPIRHTHSALFLTACPHLSLTLKQQTASHADGDKTSPRLTSVCIEQLEQLDVECLSFQPSADRLTSMQLALAAAQPGEPQLEPVEIQLASSRARVGSWPPPPGVSIGPDDLVLPLPLVRVVGGRAAAIDSVVTAALDAYELKAAATRAADRREAAATRAADKDEAAATLNAYKVEAVATRAADRREADGKFSALLVVMEGPAESFVKLVAVQILKTASGDRGVNLPPRPASWYTRAAANEFGTAVGRMVQRIFQIVDCPPAELDALIDQRNLSAHPSGLGTGRGSLSLAVKHASTLLDLESARGFKFSAAARNLIKSYYKLGEDPQFKLKFEAMPSESAGPEA